jgi:hypothetical protein
MLATLSGANTAPSTDPVPAADEPVDADLDDPAPEAHAEDVEAEDVADESEGEDAAER